MPLSDAGTYMDVEHELLAFDPIDVPLWLYLVKPYAVDRRGLYHTHHIQDLGDTTHETLACALSQQRIEVRLENGF